MEDLSDRELDRYIQENNAAKWFCGFSLSEKTPDYSVFCKFRKRLGTNVTSKIFSELRVQLKQQGLMNEVFSFVDASHLIAKDNLWKERDDAIKKKYEKLNNEILPKVAVDKQERIGCKGKNKYWYGYKIHASVDMQSGLINKIALTAANVTDSKGMKHICPDGGAIYADKGYCRASPKQAAATKNCSLRAIKKNNKDQGRWFSGIRSPYERVFAHRSKRVRYRGIAKNQLAEFMKAICFNLKRISVLDPPNFVLY